MTCNIDSSSPTPPPRVPPLRVLGLGRKWTPLSFTLLLFPDESLHRTRAHDTQGSDAPGRAASSFQQPLGKHAVDPNEPPPLPLRDAKQQRPSTEKAHQRDLTFLTLLTTSTRSKFGYLNGLLITRVGVGSLREYLSSSGQVGRSVNTIRGTARAGVHTPSCLGTT